MPTVSQMKGIAPTIDGAAFGTASTAATPATLVWVGPPGGPAPAGARSLKQGRAAMLADANAGFNLPGIPTLGAQQFLIGVDASGSAVNAVVCFRAIGDGVAGLTADTCSIAVNGAAVGNVQRWNANADEIAIPAGVFYSFLWPVACHFLAIGVYSDGLSQASDGVRICVERQQQSQVQPL